MCFSTRPRAFPQGTFSRRATMVMVVRMQSRRPMDTRSVGENPEASPPLSFGASERKVCPLGPWVTRVFNPPTDSAVISTKCGCSAMARRPPGCQSA